MDDEALAEAYYEAVDDGDYDALRELLAEGFVQVRPDRTFDGRDAFVSFMREDRPRTDTRHVLDAVYEGADGVAARGRVVATDGPLFAFVDVFETEGDGISRLETYVD
ncbi:MAG: nuclear transport factor 2 family protein [Halobacterium sp.]